ncbi:MAG: ATP-binding cassette domain-containing protein [Proteobacteria bacterium]|jgi:phospholipid/cholesterol/gamma-HCH transport system ATP-binding protein|nr:ATP-binding cassette domain-containing protein [Pseudomonadota bacterium]
MALNEHNFPLELQQISLQFSGRRVLSEVSLKIEKNDRWCLIGMSGVGKSCLLKILAGLQRPSSGKYLVGDREIQTFSGEEFFNLQKGFGFLFQRNALFDSMKVIENIEFPLKESSQMSISEAESKALFYLEQVGLAEAAHKKPAELSGGMQKRLGIARALALQPQIVFFDDPTAGLDPITGRKIIDLLLSLQEKEKSTFVTVINDIHRVKQFDSKIGFLSDGSLQSFKSINHLLQEGNRTQKQFCQPFKFRVEDAGA